ncbi:hypothetical protein GCM10010112_81370 [Actinoplanes lobatus]|uniref:Tetratricopeptide (TPR) repeat protein n=1 Tax=Actinoplanes lobatus TaxID=113568 RepID=A0A7W7HFY4_9ACTN|nr:tetratricopeptide repeat protein [Actinoplanes lobatus]MBB4749831.1 tetratricopeptide (TPR) repeat protein [Actinoplanes lobatus]GGN93273.1 hypothetical protein GCM10010112_81370 [Actinoplanes lobatus]GIE38568.1 hypothetical protein Alo02nite_14660 [Actinoplanes lobatus]
MVSGLVVDDTHVEMVAGGARIGPRRQIGEADESLLADLGERYVRAVRAGSAHEVFVGLGRELWAWLEGGDGRLTALLDRATAPVVFEVRGPRVPSARAWAVLRAPFELLAHPAGGFLAGDALSRFCVVRRLGRPAAPPEPDGFRLGLAFMASSPRRQHELDFEAEEAAILRAVDETRVDLVVEDTGNPVQLGRRLADVGGLPVVHLSCHGTNRHPGHSGAPVLLMEDEVGDDLTVTAASLVESLGRMPRLLFVSACLTATAATEEGHLPGGAGRRSGSSNPGDGTDGLLAHSMATALVSAGVPAVLGWDGSVGDRAATLFAEHLYARLSNHTDLAVAVGDARRALLNAADDTVRPDWHLARLWLGPSGGGPLVSGPRRRSRVSPVRGTKVFLDRKRNVPVADPEMFVGRRPELQRALRALRPGGLAGVLLYGQGRLGKSSLAARIADRRPDLTPAVVHGDYSAAAILDVVAEAVRADSTARTLVAARRKLAEDVPEALEALLSDLLTGPCAQTQDGLPLLLVIDDLEQVLRVGRSGLPTVVPEAAPVLTAVLRAFDPAGTDSRVLLTSRFRFTLNGLEERLKPVSLRPLSTVAQHKLLSRQRARVSPERRAERSTLAERAVEVSRGNPGLQDLIASRLVLNEQVDLARAEAVVADMEGYLNRGESPAEATVRDFLENMALDALLQQAGPEHRALLRDLTVFRMPVPKAVVTALARRSRGSAARLLGLGLVDASPDIFDPRKLALATNALVAGRLDPLAGTESAELARIAVEPLFTAWGGTDRPDERGGDLGLQLTLLALLAENPEIVASCADDATFALRGGPAAEAFRLGRDAIEMLDRHQHHVPSPLLRHVAQAAHTSGEIDEAVRLFRIAYQRTQADDSSERAAVLEKARTTADYGVFQMERGELGQAGELLGIAHDLFLAEGSEREAAICQSAIVAILYRRGEYDVALRLCRDVVLPVLGRLGDQRDVAVCWGQIADILHKHGDFDEAQRIRREIELPVYERLGDENAIAVVWSQVADITHERGDFDEALRIRRELVLPVYKRLGNVQSIAQCWGEIASAHYWRGEFDEVLRIRREVVLPVYERLGDERAVAMCWGEIADVLHQRGDFDEVLRIRREVELPAYERRGDVLAAALCWGKIATALFARGEHDEALRILRESELPVHERLGNVRSAALSWGRIADILFEKGEYDEVLRIRREHELPVYERLGDLHSLAVTWGQIADVHAARGEYDEALRILREEELSLHERRGDQHAIAFTWGRIAGILEAQGDYEQALALQTKRLHINESLGLAHSVAWTRRDLGLIRLALRDHAAGITLLWESFQDFQRIGDAVGCASVGPSLSRLLIAAGASEEAEQVLTETVAAANTVGAEDIAEECAQLLAQVDKK